MTCHKIQKPKLLIEIKAQNLGEEVAITTAPMTGPQNNWHKKCTYTTKTMKPNPKHKEVVSFTGPRKLEAVKTYMVSATFSSKVLKAHIRPKVIEHRD